LIQHQIFSRSPIGQFFSSPQSPSGALNFSPFRVGIPVLYILPLKLFFFAGTPKGDVGFWLTPDSPPPPTPHPPPTPPHHTPPTIFFLILPSCEYSPVFLHPPRSSTYRVFFDYNTIIQFMFCGSPPTPFPSSLDYLHLSPPFPSHIGPVYLSFWLSFHPPPLLTRPFLSIRFPPMAQFSSFQGCSRFPNPPLRWSCTDSPLFFQSAGTREQFMKVSPKFPLFPPYP